MILNQCYKHIQPTTKPLDNTIIPFIKLHSRSGIKTLSINRNEVVVARLFKIKTSHSSLSKL